MSLKENGLEIVRRTPDQFRTIRFTDAQLRDLVNRGYAYNLPKYDETLLKRIEEEFGDDGINRRFLMGYKGSKLVGAISFDAWILGDSDETTSRFWQALPKNVQDSLIGFPPIVMDVVGIVVLPEARMQGVGSRLLSEAVSRYMPSIVLGETRSPSQVANTAKSLNQLGFRTFFGHSEVTPGNQHSFTVLHTPFRNAYLSYLGRELKPGGVVYGYDIVRPQLPNTDGFPEIIRNAFTPIINEQTINRDVLVVRPLVSVKGGVLEAV